MDDCDCLSPTPYENAKKVKTNVCKKCRGRIPRVPSLSNDIGRATISLDSALRNRGFMSDTERHDFVEWLTSRMDEDMRQRLLTFRANRVMIRP